MLQLGVSFNLEDLSPNDWAARLQRLGVQFTNWPLPTVDVLEDTIAVKCGVHSWNGAHSPCRAQTSNPHAGLTT